jgi:dihydrofolate reductase
MLSTDIHRQRSLSIIVALGRDNTIGRSGNLIWRISDDLKRFKRLTMGHPIIMGRKTWESLPKALPGRRNIVISRQNGYHAEGGEVYTSLEEAIAATSADEEPFIIGGAQIYALALPLASKLYLTCIDDTCADADAAFPHIDLNEWTLTEASEWATTGDGVSYRFEDYVRHEA